MNAATSAGWKKPGGRKGLVMKALGEGREELVMKALEGDEDESFGHF